MPVMWFSVLLLQENGTNTVHLITQRGEFRIAALFLVIMFVFASLGCFLLYWKLDSCKSQLEPLIELKGEYKANKNAEATSEVARAKDNLQDELKNVHKDYAAKEDERGKDWKKRADKLEEDRDNCRNELSTVKDEKAKKDSDYLVMSKNYEHCQAKCDC